MTFRPTPTRRAAVQALALIGLACGASSTLAQTTTPVRIAYQTGIDPTKVPQADGTYEAATGTRIEWRKFDTGADVITAIASGDIQIGNVGSSPLAAAASRQLPIETIFIGGEIQSAEALVARNGAGIHGPKDLKGKKIAVPFVSTTHYSLLAALKHWGVDPRSVTVLNLRPPEIAAAWQRGDIDAAYVWDPALGRIKASGKVLTHSGEVGKWGSPTYDTWIVRKDFAEKNPDFVAQFVKVSGEANAAYRRDPKAYVANTGNLEKIARLTGAKQEEIADQLAGSRFPTLEEQVSPALLGGGTAKAVARTAAFLKEQGKVDQVLADYGPYVSARHAQAALKGAKLARSAP
ncbi:taurine transport system substrate-binding protein [Sphaerotilus hippei]|uniref:Taurine transport system substrate-binding protein n=1 Tax=Sphaerotilus hippei TaxID=744406 RepID=A0A318GX48_9BURK|nr:taurine ABC transporter substrate-binding protein [Sphaerotilus hippei]PXW94348.1 taurine transport system substrate-binding protein [Sphaerotilus hippei]